MRRNADMFRISYSLLFFFALVSGLQAGHELADLLKVQRAVQAQLSSAQRSVVALESETGAATGVIISPAGLILTAAHVIQGLWDTGARDGTAQVILSDGTRAVAKALGRDLSTDAGMMQLLGQRRDWPAALLGQGLGAVRVGDWCYALGHPGGPDAARGAVLRVGKILSLSANAVKTDCVLMGGDSGGPLFNLRGEVVGIHSQIWEGRDQNAHVSLAPFRRSWEAMLKGELIQTWGEGSGAWLGVATGLSQRGGLYVDQVAPDSPAVAAGLRKGDILLRVDGQELLQVDDLGQALAQHLPSEAVTLTLRSAQGATRELRVQLAPRPSEAP